MTMRRPSRRPTRTPRHDRHLRAVGETEPDAEGHEILGAVAHALAAPQPLELLALASTITSTLGPRATDPAQPVAPDRLDAATFLDSLVGHSAPETTALLLTLAALLPDNYLAQRARQEARRRPHAMPDWLRRLEEVEPVGALASTDILGDGENAVVSVHLPGGHPITAVVYIDHNLGTVVKDAFVTPEELLGFRDRFLALAEDPSGMEIEEVAPAEARARIEQAIATGAVMAPDVATDTWPACRPIVEWIVGRLPADGAGFDRTEWTEGQRHAVAAEFIRSPEAVSLTGTDDLAIVLDLLRFTTDYSGGDALRWSFVNVEVLLADWYPRMVDAPEEYLLRMPAVLRALVRYAHRAKEISPHLTDRTLAAVDRWEPVYRDAVTGSTLGPFADITGLFGDELMGQWTMRPRERALHAVGGESALARLDDIPLPDEDFDWSDVPRDIDDRVAEVLRLCDACAEEMFDVEMRTAFRRVLARTAATEPAVFRRRSKSSTAAAAIAWAVATVNDRLDPYTGGLTAKALLAHFDVAGSVSERARPFVRAFGADDWQAAHELTFATAEVLTSARRAELIRTRDEDGG